MPFETPMIAQILANNADDVFMALVRRQQRERLNQNEKFAAGLTEDMARNYFFANPYGMDFKSWAGMQGGADEPMPMGAEGEPPYDTENEDADMDSYVDDAVDPATITPAVPVAAGRNKKTATALQGLATSELLRWGLLKRSSTENIPGGKAQGEPAAKYDSTQMALGAKVEREHTPNPATAREIAKDHLEEFPKYYTALSKMEEALKAKTDSTKEASIHSLVRKFTSRNNVARALTKAKGKNKDLLDDMDSWLDEMLKPVKGKTEKLKLPNGSKYPEKVKPDDFKTRHFEFEEFKARNNELKTRSNELKTRSNELKSKLDSQLDEFKSPGQKNRSKPYKPPTINKPPTTKRTEFDPFDFTQRYPYNDASTDIAMGAGGLGLLGLMGYGAYRVGRTKESLDASELLGQDEQRKDDLHQQEIRHNEEMHAIDMAKEQLSLQQAQEAFAAKQQQIAEKNQEQQQQQQMMLQQQQQQQQAQRQQYMSNMAGGGGGQQAPMQQQKTGALAAYSAFLKAAEVDPYYRVPLEDMHEYIQQSDIDAYNDPYYQSPLERKRLHQGVGGLLGGAAGSTGGTLLGKALANKVLPKSTVGGVAGGILGGLAGLGLGVMGGWGAGSLTARRALGIDYPVE